MFKRLSLRSKASSFRNSSVDDSGGGGYKAPNLQNGSKDAFVAVMGITGSGKSSFISKCSGKAAGIGHDLSAGTATVALYAYEQSPDRIVWLIDTPGFDDVERPDTEILEEISSWLVKAYKRKDLLHGIIYLHPIDQKRMQGSARNNLITFRQLCGKSALKKVVLATTMWDKTDPVEAERRESQLKQKDDYWGWMLRQGSICHRHDNTPESARRIVDTLAGHNQPVALALQKEIVDQNKTLLQTSAGQELQSALIEERKKWAKKLEEAEHEWKEARRQKDRETEQLMNEERQRYTALINKVESNTDTLRKNMESLLSERDKRVAEMSREMEDQRAQHERDMQRFEERQARLEEEKEELRREAERDRKRQKEREQREREEKAREQREREKERERERKRQKEREREEERERKAQRERERQEKIDAAAASAAAVARRSIQSLTTSSRSSNSSNTGVYAPYALAMRQNHYCFSSKSQLYQTGENPPRQQQGGSWIACQVFGELAPSGTFSWLGRYENKTWVQSGDFGSAYPRLRDKISSNGLQNLELCCLGPGKDYYARWRNGAWSIWADQTAVDTVTDLTNNNKGWKIMAMAIGYGGSYWISYGSPSNMKQLGYRRNLKGYYPDLQQFIDMNAHTTMSVVAIALDMTSTTDYAIVFTAHEGDGQYYLRWYSSRPAVSTAMANWWSKTCAANN